mgnify:FL=1
MSGIASKVTSDVGETLQFLRNLHDDTSGAIERLSQEITETLQIIRQQGERTTTLLTNTDLALTDALLCFHISLTYFQHSRPETKVIIERFILEQENYSRIDLSEKKLTDDDMPIVIQFAIHQRKCTELKLSNNSITFKGAKILSAILSNNQSLLTLYFSILIFIINVKSLNSIISFINNIKIIFNIK